MQEHTTIERIDNQDEEQSNPQAEKHTAAAANAEPSNEPPSEPPSEPNREQLLELYERRVKPAMLESAEARTEAACSTNFTGLLQTEGLGVLDGAGLIPGGADEQATLYLRTPVGEGNSEGIDIAQARAGDESEEEAEALPESCPVLTPADRDLVGTLRDLGQAATFSEAACFAGAAMERLAGGDFAGNGTAFYRYHRGHILLALAGATEGDLDRAANRAAAERIGVAFGGSVTEANVLSGALVERLQRLGGSSSLEGVCSELAARGHDRHATHAVMAELHRRGSIRVSVRGAAPEGGQNGERDTRPRFVTLANAPEGALAAAAKRHGEDHKEIPERRKVAADLARMRGQDKGFAAPLVPFGGTRLNAAEQARALYIEREKGLYNEANPRGVHEVTIRLAANGELPATEKTLYRADASSAADFFRARVKAWIFSGLERNGVLAASRIVSLLFPEKAQEIISLLSAGRSLSPQLEEPYDMFTSAVNELIEEGKAARTREGRLALADPEKLPVKQTGQTEVTDRADEDPEPERESGPDAHGADRYAADMPGAHDHRAIATGPQAPSRRPGQRQKAARRVGSAIRKAKTAKGAPTAAQASLRKAECNRAWHEARRLYSAALSPEDRLELYLQLEGEQRLERMIEVADEPDELHRAGVVLKDEGRISFRTSGGYTLIRANAEADRTALAEELVAVMAREDIPVPEGTALAGRVAAKREKAATA